MMLQSGLSCVSQVTALGAESTSMSGISAGLQNVWSSANNPAGLARCDQLTLATSLEQRYIIKELGYYGVAVSLPVQKSCFGLTVVYTGFKQLSDQRIFLSYGRSFGEHVQGGVGLVYIFQHAGNENKLHMVSYQFGTIVDLSDKINLAFSSLNPFQFYFSNKSYSTLSSVYRLGLVYHYSPSLKILAELEKDLDYAPVLKIGMNYIMKDIFAIRFGFKMFPVSWSFGAALHYHKVLVEIASTYHLYLGFTPHLSFQFQFK
jgi:hypothetical protein